MMPDQEFIIVLASGQVERTDVCPLPLWTDAEGTVHHLRGVVSRCSADRPVVIVFYERPVSEFGVKP
jgi:hypothetical protein